MKKDERHNLIDVSLPVVKKNYFDKRHPGEESLHEFSEAIQNRYQELEVHYSRIIPNNRYDIALRSSMNERIRLKVESEDKYVYGEMTFRTFAFIFETIKKYFGENSIKFGNFYDLGSVSLNSINARGMAMSVFKLQ